MIRWFRLAYLANLIFMLLWSLTYVFELHLVIIRGFSIPLVILISSLLCGAALYWLDTNGVLDLVPLAREVYLGTGLLAMDVLLGIGVGVWWLSTRNQGVPSNEFLVLAAALVINVVLRYAVGLQNDLGVLNSPYPNVVSEADPRDGALTTAGENPETLNDPHQQASG